MTQHLVTSPEDKPAWTARKECDVHTAMARALAEYLKECPSPVAGLARPQLRAALWDRPEAETALEMPCVAVIGEGSGNYNDQGGLQSEVIQVSRDLALLHPHDFTQTYSVILWTSSRQERSAFVAMLEDAFMPVDWMIGVRLRMPHYHGAFATYDRQAVLYVDSDPDDMKRYRQAVVTVTGRCPVVRVWGGTSVQRIDAQVTVE